MPTYDKSENGPGPAQCPECGGDSQGHYQDGELVISEYCDTCKTIFNIMQ